MPAKIISEKNLDRPYAHWQPLPLEAVTLTGGFWGKRQQLNRQVSLLHGYRMLEKAGNFHNLRLAAGQTQGKYQGREFIDSDVYKWLEAAAYVLQLTPTDELKQKVDLAIDLIAAAQQNDGYLNSYFQTTRPGERWTDLDFGHELYCAGHLFQAAAAHYRTTGDPKLLNIATRLADHIGSIFGPDKRPGAPGHPEIEMALVTLYHVTHKQDYLDLAAFFINQRGKGVMRGLGWASGPAYHQDRVPVRQASIIEGHAVRAMYLAAGVTDLYLETGETALLEALLRQWQDMVSGKIYLTGGVGSRYEGESFGEPYELSPDQCYCETCATIGSIMWNWRMLLATGQGRFADLMERTLYNGFLSGLAADGQHFFYINPLMSRSGNTRREWYEVACCPPNIMRLLASLGSYLASTEAGGVQIHLYNPAVIQAELASGNPLVLTMETDYPWQGQVKLTVEQTDDSAWQLRLRIPGWCKQAHVRLNGQAVNTPPLEAGYILFDRSWKKGEVLELELEMPPTLFEAHPRIDAVRDSVAIQRGPVVYCLEEVDTEFNLLDLQLDGKTPLEAVWREDLLPEGIMTIKTTGYLINPDDWQDNLYRPLPDYPAQTRPSRPVPLIAIPYYAWGNRQPGDMRVWIPKLNR